MPRKVEEVQVQDAGAKFTKKESKTDVTRKIKREGVDTKAIVTGKRERRVPDRAEIEASFKPTASAFQRLLTREQQATAVEMGDGEENALQRALKKHIEKTETRRRQTEKKRQIRLAVHSKVDSDPITKLTKKIQEYRKQIDGAKGAVGKVVEHYPLYEIYESGLDQLRRMYGNRYVTYPGSFVELTKYVRQRAGAGAGIGSFVALGRWTGSELAKKVGEDFETYTNVKPKLLNAYVELKADLIKIMDKLQVDMNTTEGFKNTKEAEKVALATRKLQLDGVVEQEAMMLVRSGQPIAQEQVQQEKLNRLAREIPNYMELVQAIDGEVETYEEVMKAYRDKLEQLNEVKEKYLSEERQEVNRDGTVDKYYLTVYDIRSYIQNELEFLFEREFEERSGQGRYNFELALAMTEGIAGMIEEIKKCHEVYQSGLQSMVQKGWVGDMDISMEPEKFSVQETDDLLAMFGKLGFMMGGSKGKAGKKRAQKK